MIGEILMWTLGILVWANIILWGSVIAINVIGFIMRGAYDIFR